LSWSAPDLATRPFLNLRPARRTGGALAIAALLLLAWNVQSTWRAGTGEASRRAEIARLTAASDAARARIATIERDLATRDLGAENRRAEFLNERIAQRTFGWNLLFDRLGRVLPRGVRLRRLSPKMMTAASAPPGGGVLLDISGEAEDDESMLEFVDKLFDDPAFEAPDLHRESRTPSGALQFSLTVRYLPGTAS
jgi:Tfp pilus assembly protein PilN